MTKDTITTIITWVGMILILAGAALPLFTGPTGDLFKYLFSAGAVLNLAGRAFTTYTGNILRVKRLLRIEMWGSLFFCAAAYFMFTDPDPKSWIVFILAGGAIMAYSSIMIPIVQRNHKP